MRFEDIQTAIRDGSIAHADLDKLNHYLQFTYGPMPGELISIAQLEYVRQSLIHHIQSKRATLSHHELRSDNSCLIKLTIAILVVTILTLAASVIFWLYPR